MKRSRFTDQQIAFALQQAEPGTQTAEVTRKMGINEQTFYRGIIIGFEMRTVWEILLGPRGSKTSLGQK
jgi:transposase-like protein